MKSAKAQELFGKYYDQIMELGTKPLNKSVTIKDLKSVTIKGLKLNRTILSSCYRDMKTYKFDRSAIDFLCYISTLTFMRDWQIELEDDYGKEVVKHAEAVEKEDVFYVQKICLLKLLHLHFRQRELSTNMIRLFNRDSFYVYDTDAYSIFIGTFDKEIYKKAAKKGLISLDTYPSYFLFKIINGIRYLEETLISLMDKIPNEKERDIIIKTCVTNIAADIINTLIINKSQIDKVNDVK